MSDPVEEKGHRANDELNPCTSSGPDEISSQRGHQLYGTSHDEKKSGAAGVEESAAEDDGETHDDDDYDDDTEAGSHSEHSRHSGDRPVSRTSSRQSRRALAIVPRSKRRGLFAQVAIMPEVENPYDYKNSTKWTITAIIGMAGAAAPFGSSIFYRASPPVSAIRCGRHELTRRSRSL